MGNVLAVVETTKLTLSSVLSWKQYEMVQEEILDEARESIMIVSALRNLAATENEVDLYLDLLVHYGVSDKVAKNLVMEFSFETVHLAFDYISEAGVNFKRNELDAETEIFALVRVIGIFGVTSPNELCSLMTEIGGPSFETLLTEIGEYSLSYIEELSSGIRRF